MTNSRRNRVRNSLHTSGTRISSIPWISVVDLVTPAMRRFHTPLWSPKCFCDLCGPQGCSTHPTQYSDSVYYRYPFYYRFITLWGGSMKSICKYSLAMSPNVSKTVAFQTRELYTTSQKNPRQKYHFIFEIEADIVGSLTDFWGA